MSEEVLEKPKIQKVNANRKAWSTTEKVTFRIAFLFFALLTVPVDPDYYKQWLTLDWANLHIRDLGSLSGASFNYIRIDTESGNFGIVSYVNWGLALLIALAGAVIWGRLDKKSSNYRVLYYFISVAVSYSMLMKLEGLTFSKVFPTQMPELALTQLNTPFGDFTAQKLYWIQLSFVHPYETFIGLAELLIMTLLFFRPTRALGAAMALTMIGNIAIANHVYDGGIHLAAAFYVIGGIFVLWRYMPPLYQLLVKEQDTTPEIYSYPFNGPWEKYLRWAFKTFIFLFFFVGSAYLHWQNYKYDSYKVPARPGLAGARGLYDVKEFYLDGRAIPYSPTDSVRWQQVTFEKWSTISFSVSNTFIIHGEAGRGKQFKDVDRTYESAGTGGGRRHYYYEADTIARKLFLTNKNKIYKDQQWQLNYERPTDHNIILEGFNENRQKIKVVLERKEKDYLLYSSGKEPFVSKP